MRTLTDGLLEKGLPRRTFLKVVGTTGAALALAAYWPRLPGTASAQIPEGTAAPDLFLRIEPDGTVFIKVVRQEMGQGVRTAMPMIVAEELDCAWSQVQVEPADADPRYSMGTGGSYSTKTSWDLLRKVGASARSMLLTAAAARWDVATEDCHTEAGVVFGPGNRQADYGELAADAAQLEPPEDPPLKDPKNFRIIGTSLPRVEGEDIVIGRAHFGHDVWVDGMRYATLERPPVRGAKPARVDDTAARQVFGVVNVLELDVGMAVIADTTWAAFEGRKALVVEWEEGENTWFSTEEYGRRQDAALEEAGKIVRDDGDVDGALNDASHDSLEARYDVPFLAHANMLPMNCTVRITPEGAEVWVPIQYPNEAKQAVQYRLELPPEKVTIHPTLIGSGFGRRIYADTAWEAAGVAQAAGVPIQLVNTRADDFVHDYFKPGNRHHLRAVLNDEGMPRAWSHHFAGPSITGTFNPGTENPEEYEIQGAADLPYSIPNVRVAFSYLPVPVRVAAMRAVARVHNAFVTEAFLDELAHAARQDPLAYRLRLLEGRPAFDFRDHSVDPARIRGVLELVAKRAGWGRELPAGHGLGIAQNAYGSCGTYVAEVAEVSVDGGRVRVHKVWCAVDCGMVVNPNMVRAQFEGGVVFGLSAVLHHALTFARGRAVERSFSAYPLVGLNDAPEVDVAIVPSAAKPGGVGEPPIPPLAPAVANAIFAATGRRTRELPVV